MLLSLQNGHHDRDEHDIIIHTLHHVSNIIQESCVYHVKCNNKKWFFPLHSGCVDEKIMLSVIVRLLEKLRTFAIIRYFLFRRTIRVNTELKFYCDSIGFTFIFSNLDCCA